MNERTKAGHLSEGNRVVPSGYPKADKTPEIRALQLADFATLADDTPEIEALRLAMLACAQAIVALRAARASRPDWTPIRVLGLSPRAARPCAERLGLTIVKRGRDLCIDRVAYLAAMSLQTPKNVIRPANDDGESTGSP